WSSTTSTPRFVSLFTKSAWSRWAFSTHMTSSKSRSSLLLGVSRRCARPGRATSTLRSLPTSEWTPYPAAGFSLMDQDLSGGYSDRDETGDEADDAENAAGDDEHEQHDLGGREQPAPGLAAGLDVQDRGRREQDRREQDELQARRLEQEEGVGGGRPGEDRLLAPHPFGDV